MRIVDCDYDDACVCRQCGKPGRPGYRRNCPAFPIDHTPRGPCAHQGEELRRQECQTCSGRQQIKVFACPKHGECTIGKQLPGIACCATCGDYEPKAHAASVHSP